MLPTHASPMQLTDPPRRPRWKDIRARCDGLQQIMDAMADRSNFESFRPSIARAIAQARDEKQRADHPAPEPQKIKKRS
jgi:phage tail tape-measure protein